MEEKGMMVVEVPACEDFTVSFIRLAVYDITCMFCGEFVDCVAHSMDCADP